MPHKQTVLPMLGQLSRTASLCNAVNTVTRDETGWVGHNTDGAGFLASITALGSVDGLDALILGSGGAASAIAIELACAGVTTVHICSRNTGRAASLAQLVQHSTDAAARLHDWSEIIAIPDEVRLIVNATPVGSAPRSEQFVNVDWTTTSSNTVAADVIVNPTGTAFLRRAHHAGLTTVDGTGMLVNQAAENIRLWTGISVDTGIMRRALEASH